MTQTDTDLRGLHVGNQNQRVVMGKFSRRLFGIDCELGTVNVQLQSSWTLAEAERVQLGKTVVHIGASNKERGRDAQRLAIGATAYVAPNPLNLSLKDL